VASADPVLLTPPSAPTITGFGWALAAVDADVVVGAPMSWMDARNGGIAYRYDPATGALVATYQSPAPGQDHYFGLAVAADATRVFVGAPQVGEAADGGAAGNGVVHVFDAASGMPLHTLPAPPDAWSFASALARAGDVLVVSAPFGGADLRGLVFVYDATTFTLLRTIEPPDGVAEGFFGEALATDGVRVAIRTLSADGRGGVRVHDLATGALQYALEPPSPGLQPWFGRRLALADGRLAVGAARTETLDGMVSIYDVADGSLVAHRTAPECAGFGSALAMDGDAILTGCSRTEIARLVDVASGATLASYAGQGVVESLALIGDRVLVGVPEDGNGVVHVHPRPVCGDGVVTHAEECDDGNTAAGDCCDAACRFEPRGTVCGAGDLCTTPVCDGAGRCAPAPGDACTPATSPAGAFVSVRRDGRTQWRIDAGAAPVPAEGVDWALCVFDVTAGRLVAALDAPADARCKRRSCWRRSRDGIPFRSNAHTMQSLELRRRGGGVRIKARGRDATHVAGALPAATPLDVRVELRNGAGQCWATQHGSATRNDARRFLVTPR
jgi:cysteine-rich repeat protein